ncbi:MAG: ParB/RepB/Spo0J family partition protein [Actinobacteria bacterium]|nr:ParB/RepB/Spo0J family partition protein [Actinomycetota bacterium]
MNEKNKVIKIFTMKQEFPCGPQSSCCGPVGQTEEEISELKNAIEGLGLKVEVFDVSNFKDELLYPEVTEVLKNFGLEYVPVITVNDELVCVGQLTGINGILEEIKKKL